MGRKALFRLPLRLSCGPRWDFSDSLRETVWKFGMSPGSGPLGPPGGCQEAADVLFLAQKTHGREAFQLFSKQFLEEVFSEVRCSKRPTMRRENHPTMA